MKYFSKGYFCCTVIVSLANKVLYNLQSKTTESAFADSVVLSCKVCYLFNVRQYRFPLIYAAMSA